MSDEIILPLDKHEKLDFERIVDDFVLDKETMRAIYIAGMERCAEWHEKRAKYSATRIDAANRDAMKDAARSFAALCDAHLQSVATIRQWIEKEKANG